MAGSLGRCCLALVIGARLSSVAAADEISVWKDEGSKAVKHLTRSEVQRLVSGNTLSGSSSNGAHFLEYFEPRGFLLGARKGKSDAGGYSGWWEVRGERLCVIYREFLGHDGCWSVETIGRSVFFVDDTGAVINQDRPVIVLPGNGLDL